MRFINVKAFLRREELMDKGRNVDHRTQVFSEFRDAENTRHAFLSHRWIAPEVDYQEIVNLGKMCRTERDEIRGRLGYTKLLRVCMQSNMDGCGLVWVDSCCIDKRIGVELSEATNAAYRWCENSEKCYVYLHDVDGPFPTVRDKARYPDSDGWPEWFSRVWTLQELIAPRIVQFFNKHWKLIGDKHEFAAMLQDITQVPKRVLIDGLSRNRPCVAQIISWASNRRAGRLENRAYSLMGLLDVNMPLLFGEGKKAFHRLQLEIIRASNDPSIFAWRWHGENVRTGSILADDPSFFDHCSEMEVMGYDEFILQLKESFPDEQFPSVDESHFGTSAITSRGIHTWMFLRPYVDSDSVFKVWLPCRNGSRGPPVTINLAVQDYNYYRYLLPLDELPTARSLQFRQLYLSYRMDTYHDITFEFNDRAIAENGFTCCATYPSEPQNRGASTTFSLTDTAPLCVKTYAETQGNGRFSVALGQFFGLDWIHLVNIPRNKRFSSLDEAKLLVNGAKHAYFMADASSRGDPCGRIWVYHSRLPRSNWIVRLSRMIWEKTRIGIRMDVFRDSSFHDGLGLDEWRNMNVEVGGISYCARVLLCTIIHRKFVVPCMTCGVWCYTIHRARPSVDYR